MTDFAKETDVVAAFCQWMTDSDRNNPPKGKGWTIYHETAGWDLLLAHDETGIQIGIEAKMSLNAKVLDQALPCSYQETSSGPDYRAVLVPDTKCQLHMQEIARRLGITVITVRYSDEYRGKRDVQSSLYQLPNENSCFDLERRWYPWLPIERHPLPDYVPDVTGGDKSPVMLTQWKVKAIKLMVLLDRQGFVTRKDMKALDISPTAWAARGHGYLEPGESGYVRSKRTPDLRAQHPRNYAEIEADFSKWNPSGVQEKLL